jgi:hypothetical protein
MKVLQLGRKFKAAIMKYAKRTLLSIGIALIASVVVYFSMNLLLNILNADFYARLIETKELKTTYFGKAKSDEYPTLILVMHRHLQEENTIECSIILHYKKQNIFTKEKEGLYFILKVRDGSLYNPYGLSKEFSFSDTDRLNNVDCAFETERFYLPISVSVKGFPFDNISIRPMISLNLNDMTFVSDYNYQIQKRIAGRIFEKNQDEREVRDGKIELTRTDTEKNFVIISSLIFFLLTAILSYGLFVKKKGLSSVDEIIIVAGYILATAGFREILGLNRSNGISALEVGVILLSLLMIFIALISSLYKGYKSRKNCP